MILTFRSSKGFDNPISIRYLTVFLDCILDDCFKSSRFFRLYSNDGCLIGRAATYLGV